METESPLTSEDVLLDNKKLRSIPVYILLVALILVSAVTTYYGAMKYMYPPLYNETAPVPVSDGIAVTGEIVPFSPEFYPKGNIYLSLSTDNEKTGIYEYSIDQNILNPYYLPKDGYAFTGEFKSDSSSPLLVSEFAKNSIPQIKEIINGQAFNVTDSDIQRKRHPSYSQALDAVIYGGKDSNPETLGVPNEFNVYMKSSDGNTQKIGEGAMPVLTPDQKSVVVLRNDGLYKINLIDQTTEHIWKTISAGTAFNQQFTISPKGKYLAWTYPDGEAIYVLEVSSWDTFKADLKYTIKTHAFWPVFSPDEEYIAFEEVDWTEAPSNARLVIMNLNTQEKRNVLDLNIFDQLSLFVNEWK